MGMTEDSATRPPRASETRKEPPASRLKWPSLPEPVRRVFDRFPLTTYAANALPQRAPRQRGEHVLFVFQFADGPGVKEPSYNPSCLKWQVRSPFLGPRCR